MEFEGLRSQNEALDHETAVITIRADLLFF